MSSSANNAMYDAMVISDLRRRNGELSVALQALLDLESDSERYSDKDLDSTLLMARATLENYQSEGMGRVGLFEVLLTSCLHYAKSPIDKRDDTDILFISEKIMNFLPDALEKRNAMSRAAYKRWVDSKSRG